MEYRSTFTAMWWCTSIAMLLVWVRRGVGPSETFPDLFTTNYHQLNNYYDYRIITYSDLLANPTDTVGRTTQVHTYPDTDVMFYTELIVDSVRHQVIVGAMNHLLRLDMADLHLIEKVTWFPSNITVSVCQAKGKRPEDCNNYMRVMLMSDHQIFVCGTNAFSPACTWRLAKDLSTVTESVIGVGKCPYDPRNNNTALLSREGNVYVGTEMDYVGRDPAIYRILGPAPTLRTDRRNLKWLNNPNFVSSYEIGSYIYFFFREEALENTCTHSVYSRVARICKHDTGGHFLLEGTWTSFLKARLVCSVQSNKTVFHYDLLQNTHYDRHHRVLYATFTTQAGLHGSALCMYNLSDIEAAFTGGFLYQSRSGEPWVVQPKHKLRQCTATNRTVAHSALLDAQRYQLMEEPVYPVGLKPFYVQPGYRWSHVAVDTVYLHHTHTHMTVVYVSTLEGAIHKLALLSDARTCLVEVLYVVPAGDTVTIHVMKLVKDQGVLFVGTSEEMLRVPVQRCSRFKTRNSCLAAMDPYCGWDSHNLLCSPPPQEAPRHNWHQNLISCPLIYTNEGEWSDWSDWRPCAAHQSSQQSPMQSLTRTAGLHKYTGDVCLCRSRSCSKVTGEGHPTCTGHDLQVTNCTVHGAWSEWSDWSACSATCGGAIQQRTRHCSNPAPQHGGRVCVGSDRDEQVCQQGLCQEARVAPVVVHGGWSEWMEWSACSRRCGGGIKKRYRLCNQPPPSHDGNMCSGTNEQWASCNTRDCQELRKASPWSPWMTTNTSEVTYTEQRLRCVCKANVPNQQLIKTDVRTDVRHCVRGGRCHQDGHEPSQWSAWSSWSSCDAGVMWRYRSCDFRSEPCEGPSEERKDCPVSLGQWSCWSDYSSCSMSCGQGLKVRKRTCQSSDSRRSYNVQCSGNDIEEEPCMMPACTVDYGWRAWSLWSVCRPNNLQQRKRECGTENPGVMHCVGTKLETRMCHYDEMDDIPHVMISHSAGRQVQVRVYHLIIVGVLAFLLGGFVFIALLLYCRKIRAPPGGVYHAEYSGMNGYAPPQPPSYETTDQNKYDQALKQATPNVYMSPSQMSMSSHDNKYNQHTETTQHTDSSPLNHTDEGGPPVEREDPPSRPTSFSRFFPPSEPSMPPTHTRNGNLRRSASSYSRSPSSPTYSASSINSPGYSHVNPFFDRPVSPHGRYRDHRNGGAGGAGGGGGHVSPRGSHYDMSPLSEYSTMSLSRSGSRYKDPYKRTVKEATLKRNSLMRNSSMMRTNNSLTDH